MSLKGVAQETLRILKRGGSSTDAGEVRFADEQEGAVEGTKLYEPDELAALRSADEHTRGPFAERFRHPT